MAQGAQRQTQAVSMHTQQDSTIITEPLTVHNTALMMAVKVSKVGRQGNNEVQDYRTMHWAKATTISNHRGNIYLRAYTAGDIRAQRVRHSSAIILWRAPKGAPVWRLTSLLGTPNEAPPLTSPAP